MTDAHTSRTRGDLCPGVLRPWPAEDGLLVRLRLVGGHLSGPELKALFEVSERFGDGAVHLTSRANLQVRGFAVADCLSEDVVSAIEATGLLPSRSHELIRNILMSPQSGFHGGRVDLRPIARALDRCLLADPEMSRLPGRFLFVLDDGRGDLVDHACDLGLVALDAQRAQLRIGEHWGAVVDLNDGAPELVGLARAFLRRRSDGPSAPWHVRELGEPLTSTADRDVDVPRSSARLPYGRVGGGVHHEVTDALLTRTSAAHLLDKPVLVVTPWRGVFVPESPEQQ